VQLSYAEAFGGNLRCRAMFTHARFELSVSLSYRPKFIISQQEIYLSGQSSGNAVNLYIFTWYQDRILSGLSRISFLVIFLQVCLEEFLCKMKYCFTASEFLMRWMGVMK
jgi:hypothetical protein